MKIKLAIFGSAFLIGYCIANLARADEVVWNGRTEQAECHYLLIEPVEEICLSESFICRIYPETGQSNCAVKR